jgi:DMSO/TMAO reductase YedYZ molybdopterin-dependent catalytic subunit
MRNSFPLPEPGQVTGEIEVNLPGRPAGTLTPEGLAGQEQITIELVLECAGNGRSLMRPVVSGVEWGLGGASPVRVGGVRLIDALGEVRDAVTEMVFTGFDRGSVHPEGEVHYQFSIPARLVRDGSAMLVTHMGGEPLSLEHGGPVRLIVPGHYAMKSVKWLIRIEGVTEPFTGHFVNRYRFFGDDLLDDGSSVDEIQVRSVIAWPDRGGRVAAGKVMVAGSAWSGVAEVDRVALSADRGQSWVDAEVTPGPGSLAAASWRQELNLGPGMHTVMARATDASGNTQPLVSRWNKGGYANNMVHTVEFEVV